MSEAMTQAELQDLLARPDADGFDHKQVPCTIYTNNPRSSFLVRDVDAWGFMPQGVFAIGKWYGDDHELSVVIPYSNIAWTSFDFAALEKFMQTQQRSEIPHSGEKAEAA
jgi:hypothetical protein